MGLGIFKNGRHQPITPYEGSWADLMQKATEKQRQEELNECNPPYEAVDLTDKISH